MLRNRCDDMSRHCFPFQLPLFIRVASSANSTGRETKKRKCRKFFGWRLNSENYSRWPCQPTCTLWYMAATKVSDTLAPTPMKMSMAATKVYDTLTPTPMNMSRAATKVSDTLTPTPMKMSMAATKVYDTLTPTPMKMSMAATKVYDTLTPTPMKMYMAATKVDDTLTPTPMQMSTVATNVEDRLTPGVGEGIRHQVCCAFVHFPPRKFSGSLIILFAQHLSTKLQFTCWLHLQTRKFSSPPIPCFL